MSEDSMHVPDGCKSPGGSGMLPGAFYAAILRGNEYFCEIDEEYITDRFNLTGLNTEVPYYQYALDLITDVFDLECEEEMREAVEKAARHLYGLVHARYITTTRGLAKMVEKYKSGDFGKCPRVTCGGEHMLPHGMSDAAQVQTVKLYCAKCEDLYSPKSTRHAIIDGAYFGTSFTQILFQVYPNLQPEKSTRRYEPRVFGFKVHAVAALQRWQDERRHELEGRLAEVGIEAPFVDDEGEKADNEGMEEDEEDDDAAVVVAEEEEMVQ
ncbi:casein kinase 2 regulatory subunit [Agyrium rufum]|nr:casein kinase 2 regulatory subunit [Agyrium rufum]